MLSLRIIKQTDSWVLVDKPAGFHTHPPEDKKLRIHPRWNALGILERQFAQQLFPVHRLDRAASGLLLYSKRREHNRHLQEQFSARLVNKYYYVLVRGEFRGDSVIEDPIKGENGILLAATTKLSTCIAFSLPIPHPRGGNRMFTILKAEPTTGRFHQIRRHAAGIGFPLLGDSQHGDRKLNREFAALTGCRSLFLRCMSLEFRCPESGERLQVSGRWSREWHRIFDLAGACPFTASPFLGPRSLS
jgi:tRNA pseudouridine65 synthase